MFSCQFWKQEIEPQLKMERKPSKTKTALKLDHKGLSRPKRVCLKRVSCFITMYVVKWWRREETFGIPHVSSLLHHFITYIVVKHDTCFKHTFRSRQALKNNHTLTVKSFLAKCKKNYKSFYFLSVKSTQFLLLCRILISKIIIHLINSAYQVKLCPY